MPGSHTRLFMFGEITPFAHRIGSCRWGEGQFELGAVKKRKYLLRLVFAHVLLVCRGGGRGGEFYRLQLSIL